MTLQVRIPVGQVVRHHHTAAAEPGTVTEGDVATTTAVTVQQVATSVVVEDRVVSVVEEDR